MLTKLIAPLFIVLALLAAPSVSHATVAEFGSEQAAQHHCPGDTVVWLNLPTGIYHLKGQRWYGRTKDGAYVCRKEADSDGDRQDLNGQ
jgi:hypothetical protein